MARNPFTSSAALFVALLALTPATGARAAQGGPDAAGYSWADSDEPGVAPPFPTFVGTDLRAQGFVGDDALIRIALPAAVFPTGFPYYSTSYNQLWLSSNGWLSFLDPLGDSHPVATCLPAPTPPNATFAFFWDDWTLDGIVPYAEAGPNPGNAYFTVAVRVSPKSDPTVVGVVYVSLYPSGVIETRYLSRVEEMVTPRTVIGIENATGTVGLSYMCSGVEGGGAHFRQAYGLVFYPKGALDCTANVTPLACPQAPLNASTGPTNQVTSYNCDPGTWLGNEKVFSFTLTRTAHVTLDLTNTGGRNLKMFLLRASCSETYGCRASGAPTLDQRYLPPGTYYVFVDGATPAANGNFTIAMQCTDAVRPIACNTTLSDATTGTGGLTTWSCQPTLDGPENIYEVTLGAGTPTLRAQISNRASVDLQLLLSDATSFSFAAPTCEVINPATVQIFSAPPGPYYLTVDGLNGASGSYDLSVECLAPQLVCPSPATIIDVTAGTSIAGDTSVASNRVDTYSCTNSSLGAAGVVTGYTGPEDVYEFTLTATTNVAFLLEAANPDLRLLVLRDCYEGSCLWEGGCAEQLPAGTYRLVVDGFQGAAGTYTLTPYVIPSTPYDLWWTCPECTGGCGQGPETVGLPVWDFNSGNFCGTGCDFSLFAVVECGSEFHIPFSDVETGHIKIYDILGQRDMLLTARNDATAPGCAYTTTGTLVQWEDSGCSQIPCPAANCGGGGDCRSNGVVMDVSFSGTPSVCGVYRVDFLNWGGFAWQAFANCDGTANPQFSLYSNLCAALAAYRPKPELSITAVTVDTSRCATNEVSGTITVENLGCGPVVDMEVVIDQVGAPANPTTLLVTVAPGQSAVYNWLYTLGAAGATLTFTVDPLGRTVECSETVGGSVSCGPIGTGQRVFASPACSCVAPQRIGNTLLASKASGDVALAWLPPPGSADRYRVYSDATKNVAPVTRALRADIGPSPTATTLTGAIAAAPVPVAYIQVVAVTCGTLEGPY